MKRNLNLAARCLVLTLACVALLGFVSAQSTLKRRYDVSENGRNVASVNTSANREAVIVEISRHGQPVHSFRAYPQVAVVTVQIGGRKDLFSYHIKTGEIVAPDFKINILENDGTERRQRRDVAAIRDQLVDDMRILRAVRGQDKNADVLLAELAYVALSSDNSIMDGAPPASMSVVKLADNSASAAGGVNPTFVKTGSAAMQLNTLEGCLGTCDTHYTECMQDSTVVNKTPCHNNRASCVNTCYGVYGKPKVPQRPY